MFCDLGCIEHDGAMTVAGLRTRMMEMRRFHKDNDIVSELRCCCHILTREIGVLFPANSRCKGSAIRRMGARTMGQICRCVPEASKCQAQPAVPATEFDQVDDLQQVSVPATALLAKVVRLSRLSAAASEHRLDIVRCLQLIRYWCMRGPCNHLMAHSCS